MTTRRDLNELSALGSRAVSLARAELQAFFFGLDLSRPEAARNALLEFMPVLAQEYGDAAAAAAAEWYEAQRAAQVGGSYQAVLADTVATSQAQGSVRYAAGHLFGDDPAQTLALLGGSLQRFVEYGSRDTIARNVGRDSARPRFARVPTGAETCAFCMMVASRGFVYYSKETAGEFSHYHDKCDCQIAPEWRKGEVHIEGYDPDTLFDEYLAAREIAGSGDPAAILAALRSEFGRR